MKCFADLPEVRHTVSQGSLCGDVCWLTRVMIELRTEEKGKPNSVKTVNAGGTCESSNQRRRCRLQGSYDEASVNVVFFGHVHIGLQLYTGVIICKHRQQNNPDSVSVHFRICWHGGVSANLMGY